MVDRNIEINPNFLDIRGVFKAKSPKLYKLIPGFLIGYLRRVIHEDELNAIIWRNRDKWGLDFIDAILNEFGALIKTRNMNFVPETGRYVIASNHPLGGLDGIALMQVVGKIRKDIVFPVNDLLMNLPNLKELFIPINKHGSNAQNIAEFNKTFESDKTILYFPAGLVSRKQKGGVIRDIPWRKTFLAKAKRSSRDIIPVHIDGENSGFFYNLARLRKKTGLKANIEMLYLVDEMYKQHNKEINITFSKPVPVNYFDKREKLKDWALLMQDFVYDLGAGKAEFFEDWYKEKQQSA
ncbi:MAG: 1-acyl-sn-glycerol-3-phosphate acyltransferase [Bacteroidales bacterium]|nr:1-acyl-sn-glycerol-3-phosphate acyltransferase [Bacteroidales bacterium]MCF8344777.1 1-acyl-sn-glycerol-3-phosphate acyltransferase [Bacteroidales bacterium]MCF8352699.1 1-acyl-sn-glycerol-3-phosphate acyltransferase [Bacteroidales bacterium]MCF8377428.1 1-acyl-sn-glycerol-3-phosphate acyltransferase [Bacteroidales bacterium]MCF8401640.1 1-acyl-sn-glycerol-3-phosphate acyltransferase [Bacteroidales bacterium]